MVTEGVHVTKPCNMISEYHKTSSNPRTHVQYIKHRLYEAARPDFGGRDPPACHRNWHVPLPSYQVHTAYNRQTTSTSLRHITINPPCHIF